MARFWEQLDQAGEGNLPTGSSRSRAAGILATMRGRVADKVGALPMLSKPRPRPRPGKPAWFKNFKRGI